MATIKAYTDLEQSKKLAEILPIESADMLWGYYYNGKNHCIPNIRPFRDGRNEIPKGYIPAWSLAALFGVLPKNLNIGRPSLESNYMGYYWVQYYDEFMKPNDYKTECFNNPVDACYEMIIKLHELNLL